MALDEAAVNDDAPETDDGPEDDQLLTELEAPGWEDEPLPDENDSLL